MRALALTLLGFAGFPPGLVHGQALPPIDRPEQALQQLALERPDAQRAALHNLKAACKGRLRHALKEHAAVAGRLEQLIQAAEGEAPRLALDTARCFAAPHALRLIAAGLGHEGIAVSTYAAEIAAQVTEPPVTELLLTQLEARRPECRAADAPPEAVERCVWLVYSVGASIGPAHDRALRERVGRGVEPELTSPHPKVREVAVESLAQTRLRAHAPAILRLIDQEKKGTFARKNEAALLGRFKARAHGLRTKGE